MRLDVKCDKETGYTIRQNLKNNDYQWDKYQHIRNEVLSMVRKSKQNYKEKFTSHILNKAIPPGEWLRIFNQ